MTCIDVVSPFCDVPMATASLHTVMTNNSNKIKYRWCSNFMECENLTEIRGDVRFVRNY